MGRISGDSLERDILEEFTKKRIQELQSIGVLKEIENEALLLKKTQSETLLVHFYDRSFGRCQEMNRALEKLAGRFPAIEFLSAPARLFPVITSKLEIEELPYLAAFAKGFFIGGVIGFQDIGDTQLDLGLLEQYIKQSDLLEKPAR